MKEEPGLLGWSEWACLPELGPGWIQGRVDTGARSCALHALELHRFHLQGVEWVRFVAHVGPGGAARECRAVVAGERRITSSNGMQAMRVMIRTRLRLGSWWREVDLGLTDRSGLRHPLLIGRQALAGDWWVDPSRRFVLGKDHGEA